MHHTPRTVEQMLWKKKEKWEWQNKVTCAFDASHNINRCGRKTSLLNSVVITRRFGMLGKKNKQNGSAPKPNFFLDAQRARSERKLSYREPGIHSATSGVPNDESGCNKLRHCLFPCSRFLWIEKYDNTVFRKQKLYCPKRRFGWLV